MTTRIAAVLFGGLWIAMLLTPGTARSAAAKATCLVCQVTKGETEAEPVKATRVYEGKEHGFCSEKCAKAFMEDPVAYLPPLLPRPAPAFAVHDLMGLQVSNESLRGKVVLLDFWATWCAPCRKSIPELQTLHEKYAKRGFTVVGISIDEGDAAAVQRFAKSKKVTYPIAVDDEKDPAWGAFRVKAVPAAFLIDQEGNIVAQWTGETASTRTLEAKLKELLPLD